MRFMTIAALARGCGVALLLAPLLSEPAGARTLAEVQARGEVSMCANPDALPHASE